MFDSNRLSERLRPDLCCRDVSELDFAALYARGIRYYCFDVDNTLAVRHAPSPEPRLAQALKRAQSQGYIQNVCLVSNVICGQSRRERVAQIAAQLGIEHYYAADFWHRKPNAAPFQAALQMMHALPQQTAFVGDQLFTDIKGGKAAGMFTVLVNPIGPDHWATTLLGARWRERRALRRIGITRG